MKKTTIVTFLLFAVQAVYAQDYLSSKEDLSKYSEKIMMFLKDSEFEKAFLELRKYWPLPENEIAQMESQSIKQFNVAADRFGKTIGTDFVRDKTIKDFYVNKIYVIRFERHMVRVLFTFYRNDKGWVLNQFKWDDQVQELFE
jgi:hypothetical protein